MAEPQDFYGILGVEPSATPGEIDRAFRRASFRWHPDRNPGRAEEAHRRFQAVGEAYAVLRDPSARRAFDSVRQAARARRRVAREGRRTPPDGGGFGDVVRSAVDARADVPRTRRRAFAREVREVMLDLAERHGRVPRRSRSSHWTLTAFTLLSIAAGGLAYTTLVTLTEWSVAELLVVSAALPAVMVLRLVHSSVALLRLQRTAEDYRSLAERVVLHRRRASSSGS